MKKSFLSRAMSAAMAVPFALSQTILCASFAVDDTAVDESALQKITIDDFKKVPVNSTLTPIKEVEKYVTYEQSSPWNQKLQAWASSQSGNKEIELDVTSLADSISVGGMYGDILRDVLSNPEYVSAVATVDTDEVVVTLDVNYPYAVAINDMLKEKLAAQYPDVDMSFNMEGTLSGKVVLTASTKALDDYTIPFNVEIITPESNGQGMTIEEIFKYAEDMMESIRDDVKEAIDGKLDEFQQELDDALAELATKEAELEEKKQELAEKKAEFAEKKEELEEKKKELAEKKEELAEKQAELAEKEQELADADADLKAAEAQGASTIAERIRYNNALRQYNDAQAQADEAQEKADDAQAQADDADRQAADAEEKFAEADEMAADADRQAAEAHQKAEDAQNQIDEAREMGNGEVDNMIDTYLAKFQSVKERFTNIEKSGEKTYHATDVNDLIQQVKADAKKVAPSQSNKVDKIPDELDGFTNNKFYAQFADFFAGILKQINDQAEVKAYEIDLDADAIIGFAEEVKDITVTVSGSKNAQNYAEANGEVFGYLEDTEGQEDIDYYYTYFNELFAPENKKVVEDSIKTEKIVEASGDMVSDTMSGNVKLEIKRIITLEVEDLEETTTSSSTETTTSSDSSETTTSSDSSETTTSHDSSETTTSPDPNEGSTETTTTTDENFVKNIQFYVDGDTEGNRNFYFSHDPRPFQVSDLIQKAYVREVTEIDGKEYVGEEEIAVDLEKVSFGLTSNAADATLSPADVFKKLEDAGQEVAYTLTPLYIFYDGYVAGNQVYVYIGVKGDADLNGVANAADGAKVLVYAADTGAGLDPSLTVTEGTPNAAKEAFAFFLADIDAESRDNGKTSNIEGSESEGSSLDAADGAKILVYAATFGVKGDYADWATDVINPENRDTIILPKFTKEIHAWEVANPETTE
ncbi:MAG: hypothetical protein K2G25_05480 [Oscillospiraceae bacterium]|nr:hypothetical protein [Oscillospiraceae bacterium]